MDAAIVVARFLQFASTLVLFGASSFLLYGARGALHGVAWPRRLLLAASFLSLASSILWLDFEIVALSGDWRTASNAPFVRSVVTETQFGRVFLFRIVASFLSFAVFPVVGPKAMDALCRMQVLFGAALVASFAWTGHGAMQEGWPGTLHALADVLHLLAAGIWLGALLVLSIVLGTVRKDLSMVHVALTRFSGIGSAIVAVLVLSGVVNSWFLVGPTRLAALFTTGYGLALLAKLVLFAAMLGLAALNRYVLTPQLEAHIRRGAGSAVGALRKSLVAETALGAFVLLLVALLGTLAPPASGG